MKDAGPKGLPRRKLLQQVLSLGIGLPLSRYLPSLQTGQPHTAPAKPPVQTSLTPDDDQFLNELEQANFRFFWEQANPKTGLV